MYAHAHECTSMHVKGAENPHKALELRVLLSWALHLLGKGEDVGGFDAAVFVALVGVHRSLLRVHLLDLVNGLASACGEQRNVSVVGSTRHRQPNGCASDQARSSRPRGSCALR